MDHATGSRQRRKLTGGLALGLGEVVASGDGEKTLLGYDVLVTAEGDGLTLPTGVVPPLQAATATTTASHPRFMPGSTARPLASYVSADSNIALKSASVARRGLEGVLVFAKAFSASRSRSSSRMSLASGGMPSDSFRSLTN